MYVTTLLNYLLLMSLHVLLYSGALFGQFQQILPAVLSFHIQQTLLQILKDLGTSNHYMDYGSLQSSKI